MNEPLQIICAAVKYGDIVIGGTRHAYIRENTVLIDMDISKSEDGFLASDHKFYDRRAAYEIAVNAGQIVDDGGNRLLVSEMLFDDFNQSELCQKHLNTTTLSNIKTLGM